MDVSLPPCGIYKTLREVAGVPAGRLVYFHNHGNPGPGIYLPESWEANRAKFAPRGNTIADPATISGLLPLAAEGFYRVTSAFHCCDKKCREFQPDALVQLGYNGEAAPILFVPELVAQGLAIPSRGFRLENDAMSHLAPLKVARPANEPSSETFH